VGICTNQFDLIDNRFYAQRIKTLRVVCCEQAQAADSFVADAAVADALRDSTTGELLANRQLVATILSATGSVTTDKVFDSYSVLLTVLDTTVTPPSPLATQTVALTGFTPCPGAIVGDCLQKHDIQAAPPTFSIGPEPDFAVTLSVSVEACIVVSRETILKVNAAEPFCC